MSTLLKFDKLDNIRDLGGMKAEGEKEIISGRLFRSGVLNGLTESDISKLKCIGPVIVDFRTDAERNERPDDEIDGLKNIHIPIVESLTPGISREKTSDHDLIKKYIIDPEGAKQYMCQLYRVFTTDEAVKNFAKFFNLLLDSDRKPILWHCTAGKDRAGVASMLIQEILGVSKKDIMSDYLMTNDCLLNTVNYYKMMAKERFNISGKRADEALQYLLGADKEYIDSFYSEAEKKYGSIDGFIHNALHITDEDINKLKEMYLC